MTDEFTRAATVLWAAAAAASPLGRTLGVPTGWPRCGPGGPHDCRTPGSIRRGRSRVARRCGWQTPARSGTGCHTDGDPRCPHIFNVASRASPTPPSIGENSERWPPSAGHPRWQTSAGLRPRGWIRSMAWLFVHILNLIRIRNWLVVLVQWAWADLQSTRFPLPLITGDEPEACRASP